MKKRDYTALFLALTLAAVLAVSPVAASAAGTSTVVGTYSIADLGQGVWGGGSLMSDGSITGRLAFSAGNGQFILKFQGSSWSFTDSSNQAVTLCYNVTIIKATSPFPPYICFQDVPVTGTPIIVPGPAGGGFLIRVNLNH